MQIQYKNQNMKYVLFDIYSKKVNLLKENLFFLGNLLIFPTYAPLCANDFNSTPSPSTFPYVA